MLVSGASIAGPAVAYWLSRYGYAVTVVERADRLRTAGQNIDVRGAGREVARRMGVEEEILAANTGEVGTRFLGPDGRTIAELPAGEGDSDGATAELEILRGQLARLLVDLTERDVEYVFGDQVTRLDQDDGVTVGFDKAADRRFDLVVVAEGMRSRTRDLVFGDEVEVRDLGLYTAYCAIPRTPEDTAWWFWYNAPGGRTVSLRPDNVGSTRATLTLLSPSMGYEELEPAEQRRMLKERFADVGWQAPRVLAALDEADELYLEYTGQVLAPTWSRGRVVLVGDAAYCASPVSGMGTSLAFTGAYVLAGELAAHTHHRDAFARFEERLRPYVEQAQDLPPGVPRIAHPKSTWGIGLFHAAVRVAASRPGRAVGGRLFTPPAERFDLPDYSHLG